MRRVPRNHTAGFTLIELMVVVVIMGIIIAFITTAAMDGVRRAEERATQALITKLESGVSDRLEALIGNRPPINDAHRALASIYPTDPAGRLIVIPGEQRAAAIALADYLKSEMPDVFFIQSNTDFPLNFAGTPYPNPFATGAPIAEYLLPMGHSLPKFVGTPARPIPLGDWQQDTNAANFDPSEGDPVPGGLRAGSTGIFGASYAAQAGIKKNLGFTAAGYDGTDNDGDKLVDEWDEGVNTADAAQVKIITDRMRLHTHKTARSEMLYALLVEGIGPMGSLFTADEFRDTEVKDTDGDGLPEFVDAWGEPLQFFRWPVMYFSPSSSEVQKGYNPYTQTETRQQNPLDPNQNLVAPAWWDSNYNANDPTVFAQMAPANTNWNMSRMAATFQASFYSLMDPRGDLYPTNVPRALGWAWDRNASSGRRAFYSKFLILSAGPDRVPGVFLYDESTFPPNPKIATALTILENQASPYIPADRGPEAYVPNNPNLASFYPVIKSITASANVIAGMDDDLTNHNISSAGTGVR
ncbi:prepilin-type N-terminal cleavage/methylation domain-containing protein [Isosphaeraceae bacterium EP7]